MLAAQFWWGFGLGVVWWALVMTVVGKWLDS